MIPCEFSVKRSGLVPTAEPTPIPLSEACMSEFVIRPASAADAPAINAIYNHYVRTATATFDTEEMSLEGRIAWLAEHTGPHPALVAQDPAGVVLGWGSLSRWGTRAAYRYTVEISVYVGAEAVGRGVGPALSEALLGEARRLGHHAVISQIVHENEPSLKMAARQGFEHVGTLKQVGRKFDRWLDVVLMEYVIDTAE
jgi:L-amino acid N-acyltransferase